MNKQKSGTKERFSHSCFFNFSFFFFFFFFFFFLIKKIFFLFLIISFFFFKGIEGDCSIRRKIHKKESRVERTRTRRRMGES